MKKFFALFVVVSALLYTAVAYLLSVPSDNKEAQIITTSEELADGDWQCFHKEFDLRSTEGVELRIAADTKYWLWVNDKLVVREGGLKRGPTPKDSYCDVLHEGLNLRKGKKK